MWVSARFTKVNLCVNCVVSDACLLDDTVFVPDQHHEIPAGKHVGDFRALILHGSEIVGDGVTYLGEPAGPRNERELWWGVDHELEQRIRLTQGCFEIPALNRLDLLFDGEQVVCLVGRDVASFATELARDSAELPWRRTSLRSHLLVEAVWPAPRRHPAGRAACVGDLNRRVNSATVSHSQYHTTITPLPPCPNNSVPPPAATEMLIRRSRPIWVANAVASWQSSSHDFVVLSKIRWRTVILLSLRGYVLSRVTESACR